MHDIAIERRQILVALHQIQEIGAHRHQFASATRGAVEPADQFLPPRLGGEMQVAGVVVTWLRAPGLDRLRKFFTVRPVITSQCLEEGKSFRLVEMT